MVPCRDAPPVGWQRFTTLPLWTTGFFFCSFGSLVTCCWNKLSKCLQHFHRRKTLKQDTFNLGFLHISSLWFNRNIFPTKNKPFILHPSHQQLHQQAVLKKNPKWEYQTVYWLISADPYQWLCLIPIDVEGIHLLKIKVNYYPTLQFGKGISSKIWQCLVSIVNFRGAEYLLQNTTGLPQRLNAPLVGLRGLSFQHLFGFDMFLFEKLSSCFIDEIMLTWICPPKNILGR